MHTRLSTLTFGALVIGILSISPMQARAKGDCEQLPGASEIVSRPGLDFLLMGEAHGTAELPALFADLVCAAVKTGRPIAVGVEFLPENQAALDRFLTAENDASAHLALRSAPVWRNRDGRSSAAMAAMLEKLRALRITGAKIRLVAFDDDSAPRGTSAVREATMGLHLLKAYDSEPNTLVMALAGLGHADKTGWQSQTPPYLSTVQHLPPSRTLSLTFIRGGGSVWHCQSQGADAPPECSVVQGTQREAIPPRSVRLDTTRAGFDGVVSVGRAYSPSRPYLNDHSGDEQSARPRSPSKGSGSLHEKRT